MGYKDVSSKLWDWITGVATTNPKVGIDGEIPAGTKLMGKVGIDQTTPGTTNKVVAELSGSNVAEAKVVNVTLAGTRQQLDDIDCSQVMIIAKRNNTGYIYVGKSTVSSTVYGAELGELDCVVLPVSNANEIYIDASVSGEGISYVAI